MNAQPVLDDYLMSLLETPAAPAPAAPPSTPGGMPAASVQAAPRPDDAAAEALADAVETAAPPMNTPAPSPLPAAPAPAPPAPRVVSPIRPVAPAPAPARGEPPPALEPRPAFAAPAAPHFRIPTALLQQRDDLGHHRRATERTSRWLRMRCDDQHYALELLKVQEVVLPATLLPLRGGARHMLGVMNLRGQVVPVVDLGLYLDRAPTSMAPCTRIVVLEEGGEVLGLQVTAVEDVTNLTDQQIEAPENTRATRITNNLFRGVARIGQQTVILLDASQLLK